MATNKPTGNFIDRAIGFFSPATQFKRERARFMLEQRAYDAAAFSRRTSGWTATGASANAENSQALSTLRNRSRELTRNTPWAKRSIQSIANNVVGAGIRPTPLVVTNFAFDKPDEQMMATLKTWWKLWAEETECDFKGKLTFYGLEKLCMRAIAESGEVLIVRRRDSSGLLPIKLDVLEADFIDTTRMANIEGAGFVLDGIEYDTRGRVVAYWLFDQHPGEQLVWGKNSLISRRIPASDVIHAFEILRPGQGRGVPFGTSAMLKLRDLDDFDDAELIKQKVAACFSAFVVDANDEIMPGDGMGNLSEKLEPGAIQRTPPGTEITFSNPPSRDGYADFMRVNAHVVAAGYGTTYSQATGDLSQVNFSSGKMGLLEIGGNYEDWQENIMISQICKPMYAWFVEALQLKGYLRVADNQLVLSTWTCPAKKMIDMAKEMKGIKEAIKAGLISWQDAVRQLGYDPEELLQELASDKAAWDEKGIKLDIDYALEVLLAMKKKEPQPPAA